ncbi:sensor histidine kinase FexB [Beggiatoa sp. PS]|nr:sensor histidine kinase FexB [Beggiatoa sp. PS]
MLLVIYLFGARWGILIALFASSYTFFLWGHPFAIVVYSLEALFIGFLWQRYTDKLLLLEGIFWIFLGLPVIWIFHIIFIPLDSTQMSLLLLKYLVNGIANASIARLIIMFLPLSQWAGLEPPKTLISLRQILLNIIIALVLLPAILTITVNGWIIVNQVEKDIKTQLNTLVEDITTDLRLQHQHIMQSLQKLVQLIAKEDLQYQDYIAQQAKQIGTLFPELVDIVLMDAQGKHILSYFNQYPNFNLNTLSSQEILQSVQHQAQIITFHTTLNKAGSNLPLMAHALPIQRNGQLIGILISYFNLNKSFYQKHIVQHTLTHHANVSLTDNQGIIINTTRTDLVLLTAYNITHHEREICHNDHSNPKSIVNPYFASFKTEESQEFSNHLGCLYLSFPQKITHAMLRWHEAVYVQYAQVDNNLPITVIVEIPLRNYLTSWQILYVKQLIMICIMVFLGILLAIIITNWLAGTLSKLANMTHGLSKRIEKNKEIQWPSCKIREINLLTNNFNAMAQSLQAHFDKIHTAKELLEQNVQKRTQELLHEHTLLRNLIDSIPDLICYKDNNGLYLGCNKAFEEFVGLRDVDLIGKTDFDVLPYEQALFCIETDRYILKQRKSHRREKWVTYPNGDHILLETLKTPFFAYNGQFLGLIGISRDMTVHKQIEEALRQSQAMLRLVIDNIPQFIFWKDQQNIYLGCNQNFAQIVGVTSPQAIIGQRDENLLTDEQPANEALFETLNRCISINNITNYQHIESVPLADGSQLWLEINNVPLQDNNGQVIGVLGSFEDITERKQAEEKLRQWVKVLENSAEAICITNANTQILQINKAFTKITGYTEADILGKPPSILSSGKHDAEFYNNLWKSIKTDGYWEGEIWNRRKNGEIYPEWLHISVIKEETNEQVTNYLAIFLI